jgi:hypothetical protein
MDLASLWPIVTRCERPYIYMCVCVCVCVCLLGGGKVGGGVGLCLENNNIHLNLAFQSKRNKQKGVIGTCEYSV